MGSLDKGRSLAAYPPEPGPQIIRALVEGNSIRSTSRMTGFAQNTIMKLLRDLGAVCAEYQQGTLRTCRPLASSAMRYGRL